MLYPPTRKNVNSSVATTGGSRRGSFHVEIDDMARQQMDSESQVLTEAKLGELYNQNNDGVAVNIITDSVLSNGVLNELSLEPALLASKFKETNVETSFLKNGTALPAPRRTVASVRELYETTNKIYDIAKGSDTKLEFSSSDESMSSIK